MSNPVPTFYLFGEPHRSVEEGFVHVESLDDRSRPNEWTITPHSHAQLAHVFHLRRGGGTIRADARRLQCRAPCLLLMPAGVVHGFEWQEDTAGSVITLSTGRLTDLAPLSREAPLLFMRPDVVPLPPEDAARVETHATDLMRELGWARIGHEAAVQAALLAILVIALRRRGRLETDDPREGRYRGIVARLRERVEERFRLRETIAAHAMALGTSETALRVACHKVAGMSPGAILNDRALLEAKRLLLFSDLSVGEIAFSLGFDDPAYFSRFFSQNIGQSPRAYRLERRGDAS